MKKLLFGGIALFALLIAGCEDTGDNVKTELFKFEEGTQLDIVISNTSQTLTYNFRTNCNWSISSGADWISLTPRSGGLDDNQFSIIVEENSSTDKRIAAVHLIYGKEGYIKLSIEQTGIPVFESDHDGNYEIPAEGGLVGFNISTNLEYNIDIPLDAQSWVHLTDTRAVREEVVQLSIDKNTSIDTRESIITLIDADNSNPLISFNIIQQAAEPYFNCDAEPTYTLNSDGGEVIISVDTNIEYDIITPDDTSSWLSFNKESDGNTDTLTFSTIYKNESYLPNNVEVKLVDINDNILKTFSITQSGQILAANQIIYTTKYGYPIELSVTEGFGGNLVSHTYENGYGVIIFDNDVVSIPANAFKNANSITTILLPDTVKKIGNYTFRGCTSLTSVTIPDSVTTIGDCAFYDCTSLTSVTIGDSVTTIGRYAFEDCYSLTSVTIGDSVTTIGEGAFEGCTGELVVNCNIPSASHYSYGAFYGSKFTSVTIGDSVTTIGHYAFWACDSLTSVTIGDSVTTIGYLAFEGCTGELVVNCNIPYVSFYSYDGAFYGSKFTSVTIGDSVTTIGGSAFYNCDSLTSVTIPDSVTTIGGSAFYGCDSLTTVTIPDSVTTIGGSAFYGCTGELVVNCNIPSASHYSYGAFYGSKFTSVTIGDSVTTIGDYAFYNCDSLKEFKGKFASDNGRCLIVDGVLNSFAISCGATDYTIPDSVTTIGRSAFAWCDSLTSVTIPDSVTTIGDRAFFDCRSLTSVYCKAATPPSLGDYAFKDYSNGSYINIGCTIYVPRGCGSAYKSAPNWSDYAADIVEYDFETGEVVPEEQSNNEILYTSSDGKIVEPRETNVFGANIVSNNYKDGKGVITFDGNVTMIGAWAFYNCDSLTSVTIPDSVTTIGDAAFYECYSLKEFKGKFASDDGRCLIVDGVLNSFAIGCGATDYTIPDSVTTIGVGAFLDCDSLTSVTIPNSVTTIGERVFLSCNSLTSVTIPDSVTTIGNSAFYNCESLTSVTIPDSVTTIGEGVFWNCDSLTSVTIGDSVTTIGEEAFRGCSSLTSVTIGDSVTTIGNDAFDCCSKLKYVYSKPTTPPSMGSSVFYLTNIQVIYVPTYSVKAYKSAKGWNKYADNIEGYNF